VNRKGGLSPRPLPARPRGLATGGLILLATLVTTAGVVFATPTPTPSPTPTCVPQPRG
jgi:hypothetical protein